VLSAFASLLCRSPRRMKVRTLMKTSGTEAQS
jgi:hypothetical protein